MLERAEGVIMSIIILIILYYLHAVIMVIKIIMTEGTQMVQQSCKRPTIVHSIQSLTRNTDCRGERF